MKDWQTRGVEFFATLYRARYSSSDPKIKEVLTRFGIPKEVLRPFRIGTAIQQLASRERFSSAPIHDAFLSNACHHNGSGHRIFAERGHESNSVVFPSGAVTFLDRPMTVISMSLHGQRAAAESKARTARLVWWSVVTTNRLLDVWPEAPFTNKEIATLTDGRVTEVLPSFVPPSGHEVAVLRRPRVGRNDLCTCGSGRKYKHGPQFDAAWCDELAKWRRAEATFDMLQFGLRLGARPLQLVTTTPRPIPLIKRLVTDPRTAVTRAPTQANIAHLSPAFLDEVVARYAGTRLGRQEIDGELIEDRPDALWARATIEAARVAQAPPLARIVGGVDPPASMRAGANACGIVAAGRDDAGGIYVLADATVSGLAPAGWAARAIALYRRLQADALVAEVNQGGEMVRAVLHEIDPAVPVKTVHATRGKYLRAEPAAAMYAQGRVKHVGAPMAELEDELCDFGPGGLSSGRSPDRLDALVWAVTELMQPCAEARIKGF